MIKNKAHKNMGNSNIPEYMTLKEIILSGTERGGDKRQFMFLDKNKQECERSFNQTWREICGITTYFASKGLLGQKKICIIAENSYDWMIAYYSTLVGGNISVPMDCKLPADDLFDQIVRCDCDALVYSDNFSAMIEDFKSRSEIGRAHV